VEAFLVSTGVVALGEMGDKTQLLAMLLAARFKRPLPIVLGILVATLLNHAAAGALGGWVAVWLGPDRLRWVIGVSFLAMAAWMLIPDRIDEEQRAPGRLGVFGATAVAFFLAEMGDKTQVATVILAARFHALAQVVIGTTLGMLAANIPVVFAGKLAADRIPFTAIRIAAALIFAALGVWVLVAGVPE